MARKPEAGSEVKREDVGKGKEKGEEKRGEKKRNKKETGEERRTERSGQNSKSVDSSKGTISQRVSKGSWEKHRENPGLSLTNAQ